MRELLKRLLPYLKPYSKQVRTALFFMIPLAGIKTYQASFIKKLHDNGLSADASSNEALKYASVLVLLACLHYIFRLIHFYNLKVVVEKSCALIRVKLTEKLQRIPIEFFHNSKQGETLSIITNDTLLLSEGFRTMIEVIREPLTMIGLLGVALYHDWVLTLVIFALGPVFVLIIKWFGKKVKQHNSIVQEDLAQITHSAVEVLSGNKVIRSFNLQNYVNQRFGLKIQQYLGSKSRAIFIEENMSPMVEVIGAVGVAVIILLAHYRITHGLLTTGDFLAFMFAMATIMDPIRKFSKAQVNLSRSQAAGERIFRVLDLEEEKDQGHIDKIDFKDSIEFKNVSFKYEQNYVLKDFSLKILKGEKLGLVGLSGSGKSTLMMILLRLYPVQEGEVLVDGVNINDITLSSYRNLFSYVGQDLFLFNDSIRENLALGHEELGDKKIQHSLEMAYCRDFVANTPEALNAEIGDQGSKLSGGQAQRLSLARALLQSTPILLLDEATSALDNESEKKIQKTIESIGREQTIISIAHRLSTLYEFNRLVVMKEGRIIEMGSHQDLLAKGGEYYKLYQLAQSEN